MSADYASQFIRVGNWIKKNLVTTLIILLIAGVSYGGYVTLNHMEKIIEVVRPSAKSETNSFHLSIGRGQKINALLETVRDEVDADRLLVTELHNGKVNLGSVPWTFSSTRYVAIAPGINYDIESAQSVPNSVYAEVFGQIWADPKKPVCVFVKTPEVKSSLMRAQLNARGTISFAQCAIQRGDGTPLGTVIASFVKNGPKDPAVVLEKIGYLAADLVPLIGKE